MAKFVKGLCAFTAEGAGSIPGQKDPSSNEPGQKKKRKRNLAKYQMVPLNKGYSNGEKERA